MRDRVAEWLINFAVERIATEGYRERLTDLMVDNFHRPQKLAEAPTVAPAWKGTARTTWPRP